MTNGGEFGKKPSNVQERAKKKVGSHRQRFTNLSISTFDSLGTGAFGHGRWKGTEKKKKKKNPYGKKG